MQLFEQPEKCSTSRVAVYSLRRTFIARVLALWLAAGCTGGIAVSPADEVPVSPQVATDWTTKTLPELVVALEAGEVTAETLVDAYLARIEQIDRNGPRLQSVLALNPDARAHARAIDARRAAGEEVGALGGVPVLLKDNIESADRLATTAGALALADNVTGRDAPLVAGLRAQGAVILGKTNLSEWANFRSNDSVSGWSALGGQVRNPHMLDRSPCGSSSGSGAAVAAGLAAGAVGTETNGSIVCPAQANGVVGFKPTVGLVSQRHIVPISPTQDTAGPMTRTVTGAAMLLDAMDGATVDYAAALDAGALAGKRIGVLRFSVGENADIAMHFEAALAVLRAAGATLVEIDEFEPQAERFRDKARIVLQYEFRSALDAYLADAAPAVTTRSLAEVIAFNERHADRELAIFDQDIFEASAARGGLESDEYREALQAIRHATRDAGIDALLATHDADLLVCPSGPVASHIDPINGDVWPPWSGAGYLAAIAGYPHATVPMGQVHGVPVGLSLMGAHGDDAAILAYAFAYEQASRLRAAPQFLPGDEARSEIAEALRALPPPVP